MLKNIVYAFGIAVTALVLGQAGPCFAHAGHDHGDQAPAANLPVAPRAEGVSDDLEVVAAAAAGRLVVYVDRFATNEPIVGASVEVIENDVPVKAVETAAGVYTVEGWTRPPGVYNLMVAVDAKALSDLLAVTLNIQPPAAEPGQGYPLLWIVIGQTATIAAFAFLLIVVYLRATRRYDYVLDSGVRLSDTALLLSTTVPRALESVRTRRLGPALITDRLWVDTGCRDAIRDATEDKAPGVPVERALYATVLQRMFDNEPNRPLREWLDDHVVPGTDEVVDRHVGVAVEWLGHEAEPPAGQAGPGRTIKDVIEEKLFSQRSSPEAGLDLVFFNTLPVPISVRATGRKAKKRPAHPPAMAVGVVLDAAGTPVCFELWPGDPVDVDSLLPAIDRLRTRFDIRRVCLVSDLGVAKPATIDAFNERGIQFILGLRDSEADLRNRLLGDSILLPSGTRERIQIAIKEVAPDDAWTPGQERFIVCSETQTIDVRTSPAPVAHGASEGDDADSAADHHEMPGRRAPEQYILRTNTDLAPAEVVKRYRQLLVVEETFRAAKAIVDLQTIPSMNETIVRGHMFCSFLALLLRREIESKLAATGLTLGWRDVVRDLNRLAETELTQGGRQFMIRSEPSSNALAIAEALGVTLPPAVERRSDDRAAAITFDAMALPAQLRIGAIRAGSAAVAHAEGRIRAIGDWLGRQT